MLLFKGVDFWPHDKTLPIMDVRRYFIIASAVAFALSVGLLATKGLNFGIDFTGGSLFEIRSNAGPLDIASLRAKTGDLGLGEVQIQGLEKPEEALIRVQLGEETGEKAQQERAAKVEGALGESIEIRRTEVVGPAVSSELKQAGLIAVICAILGILVYIWFRFEWQFSVAAVLALIHDITITLGLFSFLGLGFGLTEVAAVLTLAGYSINDTVVVFDRIRENLRRFKKMPLVELMNKSINETLSRTIVTSVTTLLAVTAIWVFGTNVIQGFAFALMFGILIGTWSSIFVASPFLLWIGVKRDWSGQADASKTRPGKGSSAAAKA